VISSQSGDDPPEEEDFNQIWLQLKYESFHLFYIYIYIYIQAHTHTYIYISIYDVFGYALESCTENLANFLILQFG
jgi:hypothetical protein